MKTGIRRTLSLVLSLTMIICSFPFVSLVGSAGSLSTYVDGWHHWSGNTLGGAKLVAYGADEVSTAGYTFTTNYEGGDLREMSGSDAPIATYYVDTSKISTISQLEAEKGFILQFVITNVDYSHSMRFFLTSETSGYSTTCESVAQWNDIYLNQECWLTVNGPAPSKGETVNVNLALHYYIYSSSNCSSTPIDVVQRLTLRFVGYDKTELNSAINTPVADESLYTTSSYSAYESALTTANSVKNNDKAIQTEIDSAKTALLNAIDALEGRDDLNVSVLNDALAAAAALNESDYEDFSAVTQSVNSAKALKNPTQDEINDAAEAINKSISKLCRINTSYANKSTGVTSSHNWSYIVAGANDIYVYGADEADAVVNWGTDNTEQTRILSDASVPTATFYCDVNKVQTLSDLTTQKGFKLVYVVTQNIYSDTHNYRIYTDDSSYTTSAPEQKFVNKCAIPS